jgi:lipocalin
MHTGPLPAPVITLLSQQDDYCRSPNAQFRYFIISVDNDYKLALVGTPDRNYLWILSRDKTIDAQSLAVLKAQAEEQGFDTGKLRKVEQPCP